MSMENRIWFKELEDKERESSSLWRAEWYEGELLEAKVKALWAKTQSISQYYPKPRWRWFHYKCPICASRLQVQRNKNLIWWEYKYYYCNKCLYEFGERITLIDTSECGIQ